MLKSTRAATRSTCLACCRFNVNYASDVFIDVGAGKGMPILLAAAFPLRRIIGLEASEALAVVARRNCLPFGSAWKACADLEVVCGDAAEFTFPDAPLVIYMFNPVYGEALSRVRSNLTESLRRAPREVLLIYYNPSHGDEVDKCTAFTSSLEGADPWDYRQLHCKVYSAPA
jgi:predicted RNA methylase